ncbi:MULTISPECIES: hypothetical protein [unclassified Legionella]|uniref:hypothetical protein n=1 Tax=unclassified Legionella TaxID=2622702 RepID=UPI001056A9CF|nr:MULTISPECIES: hypothetical protein [unclassified Legionella]MDI9819578.1 hypothetical protein [Legionella sp. PL877]
MSVSLLSISLSYQPLAVAGMDHHHQHKQPVHAEKKAAVTRLSVEEIINKNGKKLVRIKLAEITSNKPLTLNDLSEVHTQKIHLLIIDDSLKDYSHIHPEETKKPGIYQFEWNPKRHNATYRMWADLLPLSSQTQEYVVTDLTSPPNNQPATIDRKPSYKSTVNGYQFTLTFDKSALKAGNPAMGRIKITDIDGKPVSSLEPLMGAYAHIVGFNEDFKTIVHIHPMGKEPQHKSDRGGPELVFHLQPEKAGFIKLFAQVKINGEEIYAPFGIAVQ